MIICYVFHLTQLITESNAEEEKTTEKTAEDKKGKVRGKEVKE